MDKPTTFDCQIMTEEQLREWAEKGSEPALAELRARESDHTVKEHRDERGRFTR